MIKQRIAILFLIFLSLSIFQTPGQEYTSPIKIIVKVIELKEKGELQKAETLLLKYSDLYPENPQFYYHLGLIYKEKNDLYKASEELNKAISLKSDMMEAYYELGNIYETLKLKGKATEAFKKGYQIAYQKSNSLMQIKLFQELEKLGAFTQEKQKWIEQSWFNIEGGKLNKISFIDNNHGIALGTSDYNNEIIIFRTEDSGQNWYEVKVSLKGALKDLYFINKNLGWAVGYAYDETPKKLILKTIDGGKNWMPIYLDNKIDYLSSIFFLNAYEGWLTSSNSVYHTTNGGINWTMSGNFKSENLKFNDIIFINSDIGWIIGSEKTFNEKKGLIYKTVDGGKTWIKQKYISPSIEMRSIYFVLNKYGWIVGWDGNSPYGLIICTTNGGKEWYIQDNIIDNSIKSTGYDMPAILRDVYFINNRNGWVSGLGRNGLGLILKTPDGGKTWYKENTDGLNISSFNSIFFLNIDKGWAAGDRLLSGPTIITYRK